MSVLTKYSYNSLIYNQDITFVKSLLQQHLSNKYSKTRSPHNLSGHYQRGNGSLVWGLTTVLMYHIDSVDTRVTGFLVANAPM